MIRYTLTILLSLLIYSSILSQVDYKYIRLQTDVNNAFGIVDNPRTETEILGLDFDIEVGARDRHIGVYITYGRFHKQNYQNYAAGVDYYVSPTDNIDLSVGLNYGRLMRKITRGGTYDSQTVWAGSGAIAIRTNATIKIYNRLTVSRATRIKQVYNRGCCGY